MASKRNPEEIVIDGAPSKRQRQQHETTDVPGETVAELEEGEIQEDVQDQEKDKEKDDASSDSESIEKLLDTFSKELLSRLRRVVQTTERKRSPEKTDIGAALKEGEIQEKNDDSSDSEPIEKLLHLFPKELLSKFLREAVETHLDVADRIRMTADSDLNCRKIFVHGLPWDVTRHDLREIFSPFGKIKSCSVFFDTTYGFLTGYGFIVFRKCSGALNALKHPRKIIRGLVASWQLAYPDFQKEDWRRKIFVRNVGMATEPSELRDFFSRFGVIEEGPLGMDMATGKLKGFCMFTYKTVAGVWHALKEPHKTFQGQIVYCEKAIERPKPNQNPDPLQQNVMGQALAAAAGGPGFGNRGRKMGRGGRGHPGRLHGRWRPTETGSDNSSQVFGADHGN